MQNWIASSTRQPEYKRRLLVPAVAVIVGVGLSPALASPPAKLLNKTIRVSFVSTTPVKRADGREMSPSHAISRTIYISSLGRAFAQKSIVGGQGRSKVGDAGPGGTSRHYRFEGSRLIITIRSGRHGARQVDVNFDRNFQNCTLDVKTGSQGGARTWIGLDGKRYTAMGPASISNPSCSISNGNAFAN
ncbi:MAG: hypothetical protein J0H40_16590 [Rhizobiales bacterium]|nr:hypothetical protein [Hyphomicrobiales bacterium]